MKDIYLLEVQQHNMKRYIGTVDAKSLVRLATTAELNAVQDAQRPIKEKRLNEIADFVSNDGTLSTSIVIGTKDDRLSVEPVTIKGIPNLFKMRFPETDQEFNDYKDSFDIMDGQHRLFSFLDDYCKLADDEVFEITFEMYVMPTMRERRLIFKNTNEKQEKVGSNLLMWFREKLNMLNEKERIYHPVVSLLNTENSSPLQGRIIMGAEKVVGGLRAQQIITTLDKYDIAYVAGDQLSDEKMFTLISEYLSGWEKAVDSKIASRDPELGSFSKMAGFRFMIIMLPDFYQKAINEKQTFTKAFVASTLKTLFADNGIEPRDLFDKESDYYKQLGANPFAGETSTVSLAREWSNKLRTASLDDFDPLAQL